MEKTRALFVGRFQPFHNGHLQVVKTILAKHQELIIVVGSAEQSLSFDNPFTAGERIEIIRACLTEKELARILLIPLRDVNNNSLWVSHLCSHLPSFQVVYSNNWLVKFLFSKAGIKVSAIEFFDRGSCEASKLRLAMAKGNDSWTKHVPKAAVRFIKSINGVERLKKIKNEKE